MTGHAFLFVAPAFAQDTIDCAKAEAQIELTYCAEQDWMAADKDLNAIYKKAITAAKATDVTLKEVTPDLVGAEMALRDAQRTWVAYRDKACDAYGFTARGGTLEPMLIYACRADMTRQRMSELTELTDALGSN
ncbi:lysozyme inhibitor LprI family protein [Pannonibacter tanglangensis]|uniref:lysozyme inhibitor LprI family protein n=1 Tax=Pannonibacter tanglangensis TaxID=2750084 RepID=UPI001FCC92DF|nr:lysozyme inhibitor LprI family protein [Pannonibacter sp. XCT-53]